MPALPTIQNKFWQYSYDMDYCIKVALWRLWKKNHPHFSRTQMGDELSLDRSGITRRFKPYNHQERKGYLLNLIDLFAFCKVLDISPVEVLTEAMMEYEVRHRIGKMQLDGDLND